MLAVQWMLVVRDLKQYFASILRTKRDENVVGEPRAPVGRSQ
jgi:hypothetical protein